ERRGLAALGEGLARGLQHLVVVAPRVGPLGPLEQGMGDVFGCAHAIGLDKRRTPPYISGGSLHFSRIQVFRQVGSRVTSMTQLDSTSPRKPRARRRLVQRVFDGVVASYIHEISVRTHPAPLQS